MDQLNENYLSNLNRENFDKIIKFRTLNRDHNFIFVKIKNSIQVYEPIKLNLIYSFYLDDIILNFEISPKDSSLILNTKNKVEISELICNNLSDYDLKIKFKVKTSKIIENIENLSVSTLGDIIVVIDKHRLIKILNKNLDVIKNIKLDVTFYPQNLNLFPLEFFNVTYDTKNICLSKFNHNKIALIYKSSNSSIHLDDGNSNSEYREKIITFKDKVLYLKEMQKNFLNYLKYPNSSIYFILLENLNFLIVRKIFEVDDENGELFPNFIILLHLDITTHSEYINFPFVSFSLLYDNENPIFKTYSNDYIVQNVFQDLGSGIIYPEGWVKYYNKNTLESDSGIFNLTTFDHKNISVDYLLFNFKENLVFYKIEGLHSHPYNNLNIESVFNIGADANFSSKFLLLKLTKTLDRKYCVYFLDQNNLIRKFYFNDSSNLESSSILDSEKACKIYSNIINSEFNEVDRKTFVLEYIQRDLVEEKKSIITILNSKLEISKLLVFKGEFVKNLKWIEKSNFLIFNLSNGKIGIVFFFSKFLNKKINEIDENLLRDKFILIDPKNDLKKHIDEENLNLDTILYMNLDSLMNISPQLNKKLLNSTQNNDTKFDLLLVTEEDIILSEVSIVTNESLSLESEYIGHMTFKTSEHTNTIKDKSVLNKGDVIFYNNKIYYYDLKQKTNIFSVKEIDSYSGRHLVIFQLLLLDELLYTKMFFNNYVIFITRGYINSYDISTGTFYRVRNDILKNKNFSQSSLDLFKFGIFVLLVYITNENIVFIRIPRNKNKDEEIIFKLNYNFDISKTYSKVVLSNNMIILNESQIVRLYDITTTPNNLYFDHNNKSLIMINTNPSSLFDMETFLDFFLSNNEEIVKLILNIFCDLFHNIDNFRDVYKNSKMIPNFFKLENIDYLEKIIFENDLNVLSQVGRDSSNNDLENVDELYPTYRENPQIRKNSSFKGVQFRTCKTITISNAELKFKMEEDDQETNPINISSEQNSDLKYLKNVYEVMSAENTRNVDNFTKYFILKIIYKSKDLETHTFKLSTMDLCWISLINDQEYLLKFLSKSSKNISWKFMKQFSIPLWIKNDYKLRELLETVGKNEYKLMKEQEILASNNNDSILKSYAENVTLYLFLANKFNVLLELYEKEPHNDAVKKFIMRDFSVEKNRKLAKKHAGDLIDKKKYMFAAFFFLLADDMHSALDMTLAYMKDINLTIAIIRLYQSPYGNETWQKYYSIEKLYQEYFINYGIAIRDPWLTVYGFLGQKKIDSALEYILTYDTRYNLENNRQILESIEGNGNDDYLEIIRKIYGINVFDYKLLLFAKNLEKVYLKLLEESKANVKSVQNTNFEDIWGFDDDDNKNEDTANQTEPALKDIKIDYNNLAYLCLVNSFKRGVLFAPILNLYKINNKKSNYLQLDNYSRELLKTLICNRVILDVNFITDETNLDNYFKDVENFFSYLETNKIIKRKEIHIELNKTSLWLDNFRISSITCVKSNKTIETLLVLNNFAEKLILRNIPILFDFNFHENLNLNKVNDSILVKMREISNFIRKVTKLSDSSHTEGDQKQLMQNKLIENFDTKFRLQKLEQNLYIFRLFFMVCIYLLFLCKILLSYNKVTSILTLLKELIADYKKLEKFHEKIFKYSDFVDLMVIKLSKRIQKEVRGEEKIFRDEPTSFYVQILNIAVISSIKNLIIENLEIRSSSIKKYNLNITDHYIQEQFKFIYQILSLSNYNIDNFEMNFEKYLKNYMTVSAIFDVHEELKMIYMKNLSQESNFYKYSLIPIKRIFKTSEKLKSFEEKFEVKKNMLKYMPNACKFFKYDRAKESESSTEAGNYSIPSDFIKYSQESTRIIHQVFKSGIEVINFNEGNKIQDFAINNCDISNFAVALLNNGHKKINILNNLLIRRRSDDFVRFMEQEPSSTEEIYKTANETDFKTLIENQMFYKYNEYLTIIQDEICKKTSNFFFGSSSKFPPENFNGHPTEKYMEDISVNNITNNSYCRLIESHPLLPLYITANNRGIISTWTFNNESKKSLDEYFIEKMTKESLNKTRNLRRMKFNSYGNEFFTIDELGNVFVFDFDYLKGLKLPKITLWNTSSKSSKDAAFLNNSGLMATTFNKGTAHHTTLWDFLLPITQSGVGEIDVGGNMISAISDDSSLIICNDKPGIVSFVDIRKMSVVNSFQAHLDEIRAFKVSERENFLVTCGEDGFVKIWDLALKSNPLLVESFQPFKSIKDNAKHNLHIELANGLLYASRDGSIKLLRNKIY